MSLEQLLIIVAFSGLTGWLFAWLVIKIIFYPVEPVQIGPFKIQGIIPSKQKLLAEKIGEAVQKEFLAYKGIEERIADPALFQKLKPEIENHVDVFLHEKLSTVFPLLSKFMGEKTLNQFKNAFMSEIDLLFPAMMKSFSVELKNELQLNQIVSDKINRLSMKTMSSNFYSTAKNELLQFKIWCTGTGLLMGLIEVGILKFIHI